MNATKDTIQRREAKANHYVKSRSAKGQTLPAVPAFVQKKANSNDPVQRLASVQVGTTVIDATAILSSAIVTTAMLKQFGLGLKNKEYGGYIFYNEAKNEYKVRENNNGSKTGILLAPWTKYVSDHEKLKSEGWHIVGDFHTHPNPGVVGSHPSPEDIENSKAKPYLMFVVHGVKKPVKGFDQAALWSETVLKANEVIASHIL